MSRSDLPWSGKGHYDGGIEESQRVHDARSVPDELLRPQARHTGTYSVRFSVGDECEGDVRAAVRSGM